GYAILAAIAILGAVTGKSLADIHLGDGGRPPIPISVGAFIVTTNSQYTVYSDATIYYADDTLVTPGHDIWYPSGTIIYSDNTALTPGGWMHAADGPVTSTGSGDGGY